MTNLVFLSLSLLTNGPTETTLILRASNAQPNHLYSIQASSDFIDWTDISYFGGISSSFTNQFVINSTLTNCFFRTYDYGIISL